MKLLIVKNSRQVAKNAAKMILRMIHKKSNAVLGLATGSTPLETYKLLVTNFQQQQTNWENVTTFNLDEYVGLDSNSSQSYRYYMWENLFKHLNIASCNVHFPEVSSGGSVRNYDALIQEKGGIDLQLLGIGTNGHIAFNEPGTSFSSKTHIVNLSEQTRTDNARFFNNINEVPKQAITMGIYTILQAKKLILLATGKHKALAIKQLLTAKPSVDWPCTALQQHSDLFIIIDRDAASLLTDVKINEIITY